MGSKLPGELRREICERERTAIQVKKMFAWKTCSFVQSLTHRNVDVAKLAEDKDDRWSLTLRKNDRLVLDP